MDTRTEHQIELERLYSRNELMPRMRQFFTDAYVDKELEELGMDPRFGITVLVQMALHKRCDVPTLVGTTRRFFDTAQDCADNLQKCVDLGLVTWDTNLQIFITNITIPPTLQKEIDQFQFPLPMVVEPREIKCNSDTGYMASGRIGSVILKDNYHEDDVCLDHLNRMNKVKLCINFDTAVMIGNRWKNLDKAKEGETRQDYQKRVRAFEKYNTHAYEVIDLVLKEGNEFYLTHRYDKRGRSYCQGHYINPQGTEWSKAIVEFVEKEIVV